MSAGPKTKFFWVVVGAAVVLSRLAHLHILWADEDYHLAAAVQMLHGKMLYRDLWYDKPPLAAWTALLIGGWPGWPLRLLGAAVACGSCVAAYRFGSRLAGEVEGLLAAGFLAFFEIFYFPSATLPVEPDTLMILPQLLAVYWAWKARPWASGIAAGAAFLLSPKGVFVLLAALIVAASSRVRTLAGFLVPCAAMSIWLIANGAFGAYLHQVWEWGWLYAATPGGDAQGQKGIAAVMNWAGFHAALLLGAAWFFWQGRDSARWRLLLWAGVSLVAASLGGRFAPRYFDQLLPALAIPAAIGWTMLVNRKVAIALLAIALAVPLVRFGPRYVQLGWDDLHGQPHVWRDLAMDQESRTASQVLAGLARPGDTIFIWGYRPNIVVYTRMPVASRFWDSQPVTGVPADRHLSDSRPVAPEWAERNRAELVRTRPTFLVDGLSAYNANLSPDRFPDLREWLRGYCAVARAGGVLIYRACGN